ncbi:MAG: hydroxymethylbilane synthase [Thermodesulfovibrionales bacterium]|nr:hydroxymethylbilane synthase [Thermodesulfovibrionales bacterium]
MKKRKIVIGTRGSKLALWQSEWVRHELLKLNPDLQIELKKIKTTGDKILDVPLAKVGGKGLFVKEIEDALLSREIDLAVHSMKDVPTLLPGGLHLAAICKREDPRDAFISPLRDSKFRYKSFKELPHGARVGTSSLRRACQILSIRPDLKIIQLRGNVDTRFRKLDEGQFDAMILAAAGIKRLGWEHRITEILPVEISLPAIGQGAIGIECRIDDEFINSLVRPLNDYKTSIAVIAERAFLKRLEGGCQVPIAAHARFFNGKLVMDGLVSSIPGDKIIRGHAEEAGFPEETSGLEKKLIDKAERLGITLAEDLLKRGAREILDEVYMQ